MAGDDARLAALRDLGILDTAAEPAFDDIANLAAYVCAVPTALVSLVDSDRQWFKARVGFPDCQTDLDRSVCRFVVRSADLLVIPDLAQDSRTRDNPLVTGPPAIRFYAGAPLRTADGHVLGALCVIDQVPRPDGLATAQADALAMLADRVVEAIELRRIARAHEAAVAARDRADAERQESETQWQDLFTQLREGLILASAIRDDTGRIVDWRYDQVNRAWRDYVGLSDVPVAGRTVRDVFPEIEQEWVDLALVVDGDRPIHFTRQVGQLGRWYDGVAQPIGGDRFSVLFVEVTERIDAARRQQARLELGDALRDCSTAGDMTRRAAEIVGRTLGASRAGYGVIDRAVETVTIEPDWTIEGISSIAGVHRFDDYGALRDDLARGEPLVIEDVETDRRTADDPAPMRDVDIGALVNMPVREKGRVVGVFIVHSTVPRRWSDAELAFIRNAADRLEVGIARLRAEEDQALLNREIAHRLKNSLAMVQAIANQTLRSGCKAEQLVAFQQRLRTLGTAHDVLLGRNLRAADLHDIVDRVLAGAGIAGRYTADGPRVPLGPRATLSTSLLLHELATNAQKYGALSGDGRVLLQWRKDGDELTVEWQESGGPPVAPPIQTGFGSRLLNLGLVGTGGASLRYDPEGFRALFNARAEQLEGS